MLTIRFVLLTLCVLILPGCRPSARQPRELIAEATALLEQDSSVTKAWTAEFGKAFTPENRAQFPANRESMRVHAERITRLLDVSAKLNAQGAEKFDQAAALATEDKAKKGLALFAASLRRDVEITGLFKEQVKLVSNNEIKDRKVFNEKFMSLTQLIERKKAERDVEQNEAKRLVGL